MRKKLIIRLPSEKEFGEYMCTEVDEELGLARYKDVLYDIPTGLWVVRLVHIQKGYGPWKDCGKLKDLVMTQMMDAVRNNKLFLTKLAAVRKKVRDNDLVPVKNETERNLFTV